MKQKKRPGNPGRFFYSPQSKTILPEGATVPHQLHG